MKLVVAKIQVISLIHDRTTVNKEAVVKEGL